MVVIVEPKPNSKSVAICVTVRAGSNHETDKNNGVSHFVEHLVFDATKRWKNSKEVGLQIEGVGGTLNAETDKESTSFYVLVTEKWFDRGLNFLYEILRNPLFRESDIEREKKIILEEYHQMDVDEPGGVAKRQFDSIMYRGSPASRAIIGTKESITNMDKSKIIEYYSMMYKPSNMIISVVGNVKSDDVLDKIETLFSWDNSGSKKEIIKNSPVEKPMSAFKEKDVSQTHIILGFPTTTLADSDAVVLSLIEAYLSGGISGRLIQEVREKRTLAYEVYASNEIRAGYGHFYSYAVSTSKDIGELEKVLKNEFTRLAKESLTDKELEDAKSLIEGQFTLATERNLALAKLFNFYELIGKSDDVGRYIERVRNVTKEDIKRVASEYFKPEHCAVSMVVPKKNGD